MHATSHWSSLSDPTLTALQIQKDTFGGIISLPLIDRDSYLGPWVIAKCRWKLTTRPEHVQEISELGLLRIPLLLWRHLKITNGCGSMVVGNAGKTLQQVEEIYLQKLEEIYLREAEDTTLQEATYSQESTWASVVHWLVQQLKRLRF